MKIVEIIKNLFAKKINWLSVEEIRERAEKSERKAILCSIEHHQQILDATDKQLQDAINNFKVGVGCNYCALCVRYHINVSMLNLMKVDTDKNPKCGMNSSDCPLWGQVSGKCCIEWNVVSAAFRRFSSFKCSKDELNKAEEVLIAKLKSLL